MVVFLDTGFILALRNKDDVNYPIAKNIYKNQILQGQYGKIIVTDYVYDEIMTLIVVRIKSSKFAKKTSKFVLNTPRITFLFITEEIFKESCVVFIKYFEQELSFTDCTFLAFRKKFPKNFHLATFDENLAKLTPTIVNL